MASKVDTFLDMLESIFPKEVDGVPTKFDCSDKRGRKKGHVHAVCCPYDCGGDIVGHVTASEVEIYRSDNLRELAEGRIAAALRMTSLTANKRKMENG